MPVIVAFGLGADDFLTPYVTSDIVGDVVLSSPIMAVVTPEEAPVGTVTSEPIPLFGAVTVQTELAGVVVSEQPIYAVLENEDE